MDVRSINTSGCTVRYQIPEIQLKGFWDKYNDIELNCLLRNLVYSTIFFHIPFPEWIQTPMHWDLRISCQRKSVECYGWNAMTNPRTDEICDVEGCCHETRHPKQVTLDPEGSAACPSPFLSRCMATVDKLAAVFAKLEEEIKKRRNTHQLPALACRVCLEYVFQGEVTIRSCGHIIHSECWKKLYSGTSVLLCRFLFMRVTHSSHSRQHASYHM